MTVDELIEELNRIKVAHPGVEVLQSRTKMGIPSNHVAVRLKEHVILIEGIYDMGRD